MKKLIITLVASAAVSYACLAQEPTTSLSVQEAKQLNGSSQPVMKNGKSYSQWVAEEKARRQKVQEKPSAQNDGLVSINAADAKPAPARIQPTAPQKKENANGNQSAPAVTESAVVVKQPEGVKPAPEVPQQFRLPEAKEWSGRPATEGTTVSAAVTTPKSNPSQPLSGEDLAMVKPVVKPVVEKSASRSPSEVEKTKQMPEAAKLKNITSNAAANAPVAPVTAVTENPSATSNNIDGMPDKPVAAPAPKEKSEQAPAMPKKD